MESQGLNKNIVNNIAGCLGAPFRAGIYVFLLEIILMDFELGLSFPLGMIRMEGLDSRKIIENTIFGKLIGWADFEKQIVSANNSGLIWGIVFTSIITMLAVIGILGFQRAKYDIMKPDKLLKVNRVLRVWLYFYRYIFFFFTIFCLSLFFCQSNLKTRPKVSLNEDLPISEDDNISFSEDVEKNFVLNWLYSTELGCYSGDQCVAVLFSCIMLFISGFFKYLNRHLLTTYPSVLITDSTRNQIDDVCTLIFFVSYVLKNVIIGFRLLSFFEFYYWYTILMTVLQMLMHLVSRPFFNTHLQVFKISKLFLCLFVSVWLKLARKENKIVMQNFRKDSQIIISLSLMMNIFIRVMLKYYEKDRMKHLNRKRTTLRSSDGYSEYDIIESIYEFEYMKDSFSKYGIDRDRNRSMKEENWTHMTYILLIENHRDRCSYLDCFCRDEYFLIGNKYEIHQKEDFSIGWFLKMGRILNDRLSSRILKKSGQHNSKNEDFTMSAHWAMFSMCNFGDTKQLLSYIYKIRMNLYEKTHIKNSKDEAPLLKEDGIFSLMKRYKIAIIEKLLCDGMRTKNSISMNLPWNRILSKVKEETPDEYMKSKLEYLAISKVIDYSNVLNNLISLTLKLSSTKKRILHLLFDGKTNILNLSESFTSQSRIIESALRSLIVEPEFPAILRTSLIQLYYLRNLKEDLHTAKSFLSGIRKNEIKTDLLHIFDSDNLPLPFENYHSSVSVGVSGEPSTFHTINHVSSNIKMLGFTISDLINQDLDIILPNAISDLHKDLLSPSKMMAHHIQPGEWINIFAKNKVGNILPIEVFFKINNVLRNGSTHSNSRT